MTLAVSNGSSPVVCSAPGCVRLLPLARSRSSSAITAVPFGPPAPAPAKVSALSDVAVAGIRNADDSPALPFFGAEASTTPELPAVRPDPNGPFMITAQETASPDESTTENPVAPRSRGKDVILKESSVAFVADATAAPV